MPVLSFQRQPDCPVQVNKSPFLGYLGLSGADLSRQPTLSWLLSSTLSAMAEADASGWRERQGNRPAATARPLQVPAWASQLARYAYSSVQSTAADLADLWRVKKNDTMGCDHSKKYKSIIRGETAIYTWSLRDKLYVYEHLEHTSRWRGPTTPPAKP
jgi:hypothetical protein